MTDFIINPKSVSFSEIRSDLQKHITIQPDYNQWSIFFESNAGANLIDFIAGIGAFLKMEAIISRREAFINFAQNRSSIIGQGQFLGYSSFRGRNTVLKLTVNPITSGVWNKYDVIGVVKDRYLILSKNYVVNAGTPIEVEVIVGEVKEETKVAPNSNLNAFRFTTSGVSSDVRIFIGSDELEWGETIEELLNGKFFIQSNPFGSVDAKFLNLESFSIRYMTGSIIKLQWIDLKEIIFAETDVIVYDDVGILTAQETVSVFQGVESNTSIVINAPLQNEVKYAVRGRRDQEKIFRKLHPDILDAKGVDVSDAVMKIFLLRSDRLAFSPDEKEAMLETFESYRPHGLFPPLIEDAEESLIVLKIDIKLKKNSTTIPLTLVEGILDNYRNKLKATLNLSDIENAIEEDVGVKIARVQLTALAWGAGLKYKLGQYAQNPSDNGFIYRVIGFRHKSGGTEPTWNALNKSLTNDGEIVWIASPKSDLAGIDDWSHDTFYSVGSVVKPTTANGFIYTCNKVVYKSGSSEPTWVDTLGEEITDGRLVWRVRAKEGTNSTWNALTSYSKGDLVIASSGFATVMFQCVGYLGQASTLVVPTFPTTLEETFEDKELIWETQNQFQEEHSLKEGQHFNITANVTVE